MLYKREVVCYRHVLPQMQGISYVRRASDLSIPLALLGNN